MESALAFPFSMSGKGKIPESVVRTVEALREERLAAALRENLRRRKIAKNRDAAEERDDDEGPQDDRD